MSDRLAYIGPRGDSDALGALTPQRGNANDPGAGYALWVNPTYRVGTAYQDAGRTIPAAIGDPVGGLYDPTNGITAGATGAARPTLSSTGLTFNGASNYLDALIGERTQPETLYIVVQGAVDSFIADAISASFSPRILITGTTSYDFYNAAGGYIPLTVASATALAVLCAASNGVSSSLTQNTTTAAGAMGAYGAGLRLGAIGGATPHGFLVGEIREVLLYRADHDAARRSLEIAKAARRCVVTL